MNNLNESSSYKYAIKLLSKKDYSKYKLLLKLQSKNYESYEIDEVINLLIEKKFLREDEYIRSRVKSLMNKGYSKSYIHQKLEQEYLDATPDIINSVFDEYRLTETKQVKNLISKKLKNSVKETPITDIEKVKITRFLASKGHSLENVDQSLSNWPN
jgi:regulatory protein